MKSTIIRKFILIALSQWGVREVGGNNKGPQIEQYNLATWLPRESWGAWCVALVAWCMKQLFSDPDALAYFKFDAKGAEGFRLKGANCNDVLNWAKKHPDKVHIVNAATGTGKAGDIVLFSFKPNQLNHTALVIEDQLVVGGDFISFEGNTNQAGSAEGDEACCKIRGKQAKYFIRWII